MSDAFDAQLLTYSKRKEVDNRLDDGFTYVVEYDIPQNPKLRQRFYRAIHRYLEEEGSFWKWSTQSVVITDDPNFADYVFNQAIQVGGRARLYLARPLRDWRDYEEVEKALQTVTPITPGR